MFTIPSLALFVVLPLIIPTRILDEANVIVALTLYTSALLVRAVFEALDAVPAQVRDAASAVGYRPITRILKVELPLSIPVLVAGLRVVVVTNISMVSVGAVIGIGGLGTWFTEGYQANKSDQIVAGIIAIFVLAVVIDVALMLGRPARHALGTGVAPRPPAADGAGGGWLAMNFLDQALSYMFTADNWFGPVGLAARMLEHLEYTAAAVAVSALIAVPIGLVVGHTGRGTLVVVSLVNALRALPTLGVLLLAVLLWGLGLVPPIVALMLLGIPPLLAGTYAGVSAVDRTVVDAARVDGHERVAGAAAGRGAQRAAADPGWVADRDAASRRHRHGGGLRQPRRAGPLPDRRHQGAPVPHRAGRCADGGCAGADPRRRAGLRGVGVGARYRATAPKATPPDVDICAAVA